MRLSPREYQRNFTARLPRGYLFVFCRFLSRWPFLLHGRTFFFSFFLSVLFFSFFVSRGRSPKDSSFDKFWSKSVSSDVRYSKDVYSLKLYWSVKETLVSWVWEGDGCVGFFFFFRRGEVRWVQHVAVCMCLKDFVWRMILILPLN